MKRGDVVRVNVAAFYELPKFEYGILVEIQRKKLWLIEASTKWATL